MKQEESKELESVKEVSITEDNLGEIAGVQENMPEAREMTEEEFMNDPSNIDGSFQLATLLIKIMGEKWFTADQLVNRSGMDRMQAIQKLQMLRAFGHASVRLGSYQDKTKYFRQPMWMIAISVQHRLKIVEAVIVDCKHQLDKLNSERNSILAEIEKGQTVN